MADEVLPDLSIVLGFLRSGQGVSKTELGRLSGVPPKLIHEYERGRKALNRKRLEKLISFLGLPPEAVDETLARLEANRAAARPPNGGADRLSESHRRIEAAAVRGGRMAADFVRSFLTLLTLEGEALTARQEADFLWSKLKRRKPAERRVLVEDSKRFRTWALCEKVAAESIEAAGNDPREALDLAELSLRIAERVPGEQAWRWRLQGYAGVHVANARRVCGDLRGADYEIARAKKLWEAGAPGDPGLLNEVWLPWIEATLRHQQRQFAKAQEQIDKALASDRGELRGKLLLTKAQILHVQGDTETSTALLQEAVHFIDTNRDPRIALGLRFQLLANLCQENRVAEAAPRLAEVRALAERQGKELDLVRVVWLEGRIGAGLGRWEEARKAFEQVRRELAVRKVAYDYALVSLELALVLLEQGRTAEVRTVAEEMFWILQGQGVHREALAALQIFCEAAKRDAVTAELTRRVIRYLYRAQQDPELRFEEQGADAR